MKVVSNRNLLHVGRHHDPPDIVLKHASGNLKFKEIFNQCLSPLQLEPQGFK